jgi:ferredoxin-NADP reductase/ferredoxin
LASRFLSAHVRDGYLLEVSAPRGSFTLAPGPGPIALISGGIGITPLLAMLHTAVSDEGSSREVWWFHSARDSAHDAFSSQARTLIKALKRGHLCNVYSRPGADDLPGSNYDVKGHLSVALLQQMGVPRSADFYLCGPTGFLADLLNGLKAWQVDASRVHTEVFGPSSALAPGVVGAVSRAPHVPPGPEGTGPRVTFLRSGVSLCWDARFRSLLELAEACSVSVRWSCRSGVCHNCESGLIDGRVHYSHEPLDPPPEGVALICCTTPMTDVALDL